MKKLILSAFFLFLTFSFSFSQDIQQAYLAGTWYPEDPILLRQEITKYLATANPPFLAGKIAAFICPHAGMVYSGEVAAYGFKALAGRKIDTVIVVGFSHRLDYDGIAAFDKDGFKTPLGILYTNREMLDQITSSLSGTDKIYPDAAPFNGENSVELILPFIQVALGNPKVLLLAIGQQSLENAKILGEALYRIAKDKEDILVIASTDMSHYLAQEEAERADIETAELIAKMHPDELFLAGAGKNKMCGTAAVVATEVYAEKIGANKVEILKMQTSAKASGDAKRVVGYLSAAFIKEDKEKAKESSSMEELLNAQERQTLLKLARDTIKLYLTKGEELETNIQDKRLHEIMGVFVTLHKEGQLRGCIGNIVGSKPLWLGVRDMAIASSTQDPRFPAVTKDELSDIEIEISVLSPLKKITNADEIILGEHGVLVKKGWQSGVYLPQVAIETGWNKFEFMNSLCAHKAGLEADCWQKGDCEIYIFTAEVFSEYRAGERGAK